MIRKIALLIAAVAFSMLFAGCANTVIVAETLQQPLNGKIYTKCNIWYENPEKISAINIQKGKILPLGTEVELVNATSNSLLFETTIVFKDKKGNAYTIKFDNQLMMITPQSYLTQIFTLDDKVKMTAGLSPELIVKLEKGIITPGMTKREVLLAYGTPVVFRTPSTTNSTWIYWIDDEKTIRVVFNAEKVKTILNLNE